jgi:hypothetical protein
MLLLLLSLAAPAAAAAAANSTILVEMYSDAQCPCSAQFTWDIKNLMDDPDFEAVDMRLWFVGGGATGTEPGKCIHGEGECVGQRFFVCAQNMSRSHSRPPLPPTPTAPGLFGPSYRQTSQWLEFQRCAYGPCDGSMAVLGASHPCKTYTTFNEFTKNDIMQRCAKQVGLDWGELSACGGGARGQALLTQSGEVSKQRHVEYGLQGLPVVRINGVLVKTHKLIPVVCGPSAHATSDGSSPGKPEVLEQLCAIFKGRGGPMPRKCSSSASTGDDASN